MIEGYKKMGVNRFLIGFFKPILKFGFFKRILISFSK